MKKGRRNINRALARPIQDGRVSRIHRLRRVRPAFPDSTRPGKSKAAHRQRCYQGIYTVHAPNLPMPRFFAFRRFLKMWRRLKSLDLVDDLLG